MDPCTNDYTHCIYDFGQPCLTLLTSSTKVAYDNYNTIWINEHSLSTSLQLLITIIIIILLLLLLLLLYISI
jgi:hypothetical protein